MIGNSPAESSKFCQAEHDVVFPGGLGKEWFIDGEVMDMPQKVLLANNLNHPHEAFSESLQ